ncbi:MAG TPA: hypothetical protein DG942_00255 [Ruminococcaceae bacterium]|jgi:hypothetical protein|nr:hypothetical protein [Oscillospiraceae bacterium]
MYHLTPEIPVEIDGLSIKAPGSQHLRGSRGFCFSSYFTEIHAKIRKKLKKCKPFAVGPQTGGEGEYE